MHALFINPGGIGDQILLLPSVKIFKERYPKIEIDLVTEPRSSCIGELTNLYRKIREFNFKDKNPNIFHLRNLLRKRKYDYLFSTGSSYKANFVAFLSNADIKIGFYNGIFSPIFLTQCVKLNTNQYAGNMFAQLLSPIIPEMTNLILQKDLTPEIKINIDAIEWAKEMLTPRIRDKYYAKKIFIHPGTSKLSQQKNILKGWSPKNWAILIEKLLEKQDNVVILLGGKDDIDTISEIHKKLTFFARPKNYFDLSTIDMSIAKLAALISFSDLLISVDSAPMHIGVGLGKKLVSIFGPTDPKKLLPKDPRFLPVYMPNLECRPCLFDKRKESCSKPDCLDVTPEMVLNEVQKQIK